MMIQPCPWWLNMLKSCPKKCGETAESESAARSRRVETVRWHTRAHRPWSHRQKKSGLWSLLSLAELCFLEPFGLNLSVPIEWWAVTPKSPWIWSCFGVKNWTSESEAGQWIQYGGNKKPVVDHYLHSPFTIIKPTHTHTLVVVQSYTYTILYFWL